MESEALFTFKEGLKHKEFFIFLRLRREPAKI